MSRFESPPDHLESGPRQWYYSGMSSTLTPEQVAELERSGGSPMVMEDPRTRRGYVLVPQEAYRQIRPLFEAIMRQTQGEPQTPAQEDLVPSEWDDAKDERRCELIDKKHDTGLSSAEQTELDHLQLELGAHQRLVAPRPLAVLELIEEALRQRAANRTGRAT
jgi:hypothetical protein